ncbi:MAG: hypothetical protein JL57_09995 [Desulfosporosinus sp. BICA1-9]|nr:MAG: hypothetical protein JL57_09995 [Desulfosporosinus sp. BICA1-9]
MRAASQLAPPLYYSTLGFDADLIDYLSFIKDEYIRFLFPRPILDPRGRKPWDAVILFRMHVLYFTRPEFVSFRQMCTELAKPKHQDYRNFLGIKGTSIPSHAALSRFRAQLGIEETTINELSKPLLRQAEQLDGFLNLMIGALDSRPVFAAVGGFKKECTCKTPEKCTCPPRFSDNDAKVGRQRTKVNQNKFFIGYRKNTVICGSSQGPMPLGSVVVHAKTSDSNMLLPCLERLKELEIQLPNMVADMAYIDGQDKIDALKIHNTVVFTEVKKDMIRPEVCDEQGRVLCSEGHLAVYDGFDTETMMVQYIGDPSHCDSCLRWGTCDKRFEFSFLEKPQFFGPIAQGSQWARSCLNFRKQVELNFALEANLLDHVFHHKKLPIRGQKRVEIYLRLVDLSRLIMGMIHHAQEYLVPKGRSQELRRLAEEAIYDRKFVLLRTA